jgi:hypothetical protein
MTTTRQPSEIPSHSKFLWLKKTEDPCTKLQRATLFVVAAFHVVDALQKIEKAVSKPDETLLDKLKVSAEAISAASKAISSQPG